MTRMICCATSVLVAMAGCLFPPAATPRDYLGKTLAPKAAFDLQCDAAQLEFANLGPAEGPQWWDGQKEVLVHDLSTQQGVTGCGRRGRYVYHRGEWILNADTQATAPQPTAAPK